MIKAIRETGRTPVQRNTFYQAIKVWDDAPPAEVRPTQARQKFWRTTLPRREPLLFFMPTPDNAPKLRLAPPETPEELAHRFARETRPVLLQRECALENSLSPFRVGSVPYLNAAPLTRGLEEQIIFVPPSALAEHAAPRRVGRGAGQRHRSIID